MMSGYRRSPILAVEVHARPWQANDLWPSAWGRRGSVSFLALLAKPVTEARFRMVSCRPRKSDSGFGYGQGSQNQSTDRYSLARRRLRDAGSFAPRHAAAAGFRPGF